MGLEYGSKLNQKPRVASQSPYKTMAARHVQSLFRQPICNDKKKDHRAGAGTIEASRSHDTRDSMRLTKEGSMPVDQAQDLPSTLTQYPISAMEWWCADYRNHAVS